MYALRPVFLLSTVYCLLSSRDLRHDFYRDEPVRPDESDRGRRAGGRFGEKAVEVVDAGDRASGERHDHVAVADARALGGAAGFDRYDEDAARGAEVEVPHDAAVQGNGLAGDPDPGSPDRAVADQAARDV